MRHTEMTVENEEIVLKSTRRRCHILVDEDSVPKSKKARRNDKIHELVLKHHYNITSKFLIYIKHFSMQYSCRLKIRVDCRYIYRTGDRGRLDAQGHIYFAGRLDNQVKRHGCRIQLESIDSVGSIVANYLKFTNF